MKYKIEFEGDYYEEFDELRRIAAFREMDKAINIALSLIRQRLKYQNPTEEEVQTLERLREILYIPEIDS